MRNYTKVLFHCIISFENFNLKNEFVQENKILTMIEN